MPRTTKDDTQAEADRLAEAELLGELEAKAADEGDHSAEDRSPKIVAAKEAPAERLHPHLSNAEVEAAKARARKRIEDEIKKQALKAIEDDEAQRLRVEEGFTTGDPVQDAIVSITLNLAPHSDRIVLDGRAYFHGRTYDLPRRVANVMAEAQHRGWVHQDILDGKDILQHLQQHRLTAISERMGGAHVGGVMPSRAA